jgi:hypothetical protein
MTRSLIFPVATVPLSFGKSVVFNGTTSYISASKGTMVAAVGSVVCWIRCTTDWTSIAEPKTIWEFNASTGLMSFAWENWANGLDLSTWNAGFASIDNLAIVPLAYIGLWPKANVWAHLAVTWNGSVGNPLNAKIYLDGHDLGIQVPGIQNCTTIGNMVIGGGSTLADHKPWDGHMDEFAVYDRVLTAQEILDIYNQAVYPASGLVTRYNFDEASGGAVDISPNGNHGELNNVTRSATVVLNAGY